MSRVCAENVADTTRQQAVSFVKEMHGDKMRRRGMLYCGGAPPVMKALNAASKEFNISISIDYLYREESLSW